MRGLIGALVTAVALAASPAMAMDRTWNPLPTTQVPVGTDLRLHVLTLQTADAPVDINAQGAAIRKGFGGSMIDVFPLSRDGFHLSMGSRMTSRGAYINLNRDDDRVAELLSGPGRTGYRPSRKITPALTMGYSREAAKGLTLGVEAGAMLGHFDAGYYSAIRPSRFGLHGSEMGGRPLNQVARATMAFRF